MADKYQRSRSAAVAACALVAATSALAQTRPWAENGGWEISYYPEAQGCSAYGLFEANTAFFIGFDGTGNSLSLNVTLIDQSWTQIADGQDYPVQVRFGTHPAWTLDMDGQVVNAYPALNIHIDAQSPEAEQFLRQFREETEMTWTVGDEVLARLTLRGSMAAFDAVIACQEADHDAHVMQAGALAGPAPLPAPVDPGNAQRAAGPRVVPLPELPAPPPGLFAAPATQ